MSEADDYTPQLWVYVGRREGHTNPSVDAFHVLNDNGLVTENSFAFKAKRSMRTIGGIYEVSVSPDGTKARVDSAQFKRMHSDTEAVAKWKAQHDAHEALREVDALEKNGKQLHLEALKPLRDVYVTSGFRQQLALEVLVLRYLRQGK